MRARSQTGCDVDTPRGESLGALFSFYGGATPEFKVFLLTGALSGISEFRVSDTRLRTLSALTHHESIGEHPQNL
jgi:hypothetical protein